MSTPEQPDHAPPPYPPGSVRTLLPTPHVSDATRRVLQTRLNTSAIAAPSVFTAASMAALRAMCDRLVPQHDLPERIDIAGQIDQRLASGESDGWRFATMPPDAKAWLLGLNALDRESGARFSLRFADLDGAHQDALLREVQTGSVQDPMWHGIDPTLFFADILAEAVEIFYASPIAQEEIGYVGMADLPGWTHIGLNELHEREPRPHETPVD